MNNFAPEPILRASLKVLHIAAVYTRNWTLNDEVSRKQLNDLWEAIHEIPDLLTRWETTTNANEELLMYLKEYDEKWDSPSLQNIYNDNLNDM
jgi:hypothetical protein